MPKTLITSKDQFREVEHLIDNLGIGAYRDAKVEAGLCWDTPFQGMYRMEAETVLGILREKLKSNEI